MSVRLECLENQHSTCDGDECDCHCHFEEVYSSHG